MHTDSAKKRDKSAKPVSDPRSSTGSAMPCWYFEKKELRKTPSLQDGIDYETESRYRKEGARFIIDTGTKMDLGYNTMATGVVYFHRFYMYHSFKHFPRYVTACCCLFLAGKVEETPKKCKDIIKTARGQLTDAKFATFGEDPKEEVMTLERILLQTIKFDLQVEHPYGFLLKYAKCLKGDKAKLQKMVQMAWTFVNDSLCTTLCLQWEPEVIAVALMYLAGKLSKFEVVDWQGRSSKHLRWWDMFVEDVTMDLLEDICHQVLDLYSHPQNSQAPDSPPYIRSPPPVRKERNVPQPISPGQLSHSPIQPGVPPKVKNDTKAEDGMDKVDGSAPVHFGGYNSTGPPSAAGPIIAPGPGPGPGAGPPFPSSYAAPPASNAGPPPVPAQAPASAAPAPFPPSYPAGQYYPPPPHGPTSHGQPPHGPPPMGPPPHGIPPHGPPSHGPPSHGPPSHGPPSHGTTSHGPPSHGPPSHGPPSHGPPPHGPPPHGPPPHGLPPGLPASRPPYYPPS